MKRKSLKRKADSYNRRKYRRQVIRELKGIKRVIRKVARRGKHQSTWTFGTEYHFVLFHALRLFSYKYPDFEVQWYYEGRPYSHAARWDNDKKYRVTIIWE